MRQRAELSARFQNTASPYTLRVLPGGVAKSQNPIGLLDRFEDPAVTVSIAANDNDRESS